MTEDIWPELLRSPLDDAREEGRASAHSRLWVIPVAIAGGVVFGLIWLAATGSDKTAEAATTTTPSTTVSEEPASGFPPGYVEVSIDGEPVGGSVGLRPEVVYEQGGDLYVILSTAVKAKLDPERVVVFGGGDWNLDVNNSVKRFGGEITNPQSLGLIAVRFDGAGGTRPGEGTIYLRPVAAVSRADFTEPVVFNGLPARIEGPLEFDLEDNVTLVIDQLDLGTEAGTIAWHLEAPSSIRAQLDAVVEFPETIESGGGFTALVSEHLSGPYPFQRPPLPRPMATWNATDVLRRAGPDIVDAVGTSRGTLRLTVNWQQASANQIIEILVVIGAV